MSLPPAPSCLVPECTSKVAQAAFPHGNRYIQMREAFGTLYTNAQFADLYPQGKRIWLTPLTPGRDNLDPTPPAFVSL